MTQSQTDLRNGPDANGLFGAFGGRYVAETLMPLILDLAREYEAAKIDPAFNEELAYFQRDYVGRPSPLYFAERLTEFCGGAKIYLKREELNHTGAHKINNCIGQILLARRMGKKRIIAETGAGMHGVATATVAARFGLQCVIYMGTTDIERQQANVFRMKLLGAEVIPVVAGTGTLKDAMNEALRDWVTNVDDTFYLIGTVAGPHPYPAMVRDFQSVIGKETRTQLQAQEGRLPDSLVACIGGGSNAMGLFHPFLDDSSVEIIGVEAAGFGIETGKHAASLNGGVPGVLHGNRTFLLQDDDGQIIDAHSISAGLDYPGIGPEHAWLHDIGRVQYTSVTDHEALDAFHKCCRLEGIIPALESAHAPGRSVQTRTDPAEGTPDGGQPVRPWRQRHADRDAPHGTVPAGETLNEPPANPLCATQATKPRRPGDLRHPPATPGYDTSLAILKGLPAAGADVIELGMPFTDPMADGPAIQLANIRALSAKQNLAKTLQMVRGVPQGQQRHPAGADGLLQPDPQIRRAGLYCRRQASRGRRPDRGRPAART